MKPRTIVLLRALQLGDLLCAVPAFRSLRAAFPQAHIALIGLPWSKTFVNHRSGMRTPFLLERFPDIDLATLQDPQNVAETVRYLLRLPSDRVVPEMTVITMRETSWP